MAFSNPVDLESCGPFIPSAVFVRPGQPENPEAFFKGQLGVLQPTYRRRYLALAYRLMSGLPLSPEQVRALTQEPAAPNAAVARWEAARQQVASKQPVAINQDTRTTDFDSYRNCNDDAFDTAVATLQDRIRLAGADSPEARDWAAAQDDVFWNCGSADTRIPAVAPAGSSARIRSDRNYQIAAAYFYAGQPDEARRRFQDIARDPDSPWRVIAPYVVARVDIRKKDLPAAQADLDHILKDANLLPIHSKAAALLGLVNGKIDPHARLMECSKRLLSADSTTLVQDLADFTFLYDKHAPTQGAMAQPIPALMNKDDLIPWIEIMQGRESGDLAIPRWQRDRSIPWLIAALSRASGKTAQASELITAGLDVPATSPAWATARYHAVRLLVELDRASDARKAFDAVTPVMTSLTRSTQNAFLSEKMQTAETLDEFLAGAIRLPMGSISDVELEELPAEEKNHRLLGDDAARVFDSSLPIDVWLQAVKPTHLPVDLRKHLAQTGFVRAFLLKNPLAADFAQIVAQLSPDDAASMRRFIAATQPDDRFYEGLFWLLHRPGIGLDARGGFLRSEADQKIDSYRDNWWLSQKEKDELQKDSHWPLVPPLSFLSAQQKKQGNEEARELAGFGSARLFFATQVLAWAQAHPDDPRLAEALAMTIRVSRYSHEDPTASTNVERAFNVLHQRFPASTWAKQTPYWFK